MQHKKTLQLGERKDKLPTKEGTVLASASRTLDFCARAFGLLISRDLEPRILFTAQQVTKTNDKTGTGADVQRPRSTPTRLETKFERKRKTWDLSKSGPTPRTRAQRGSG